MKGDLKDNVINGRIRMVTDVCIHCVGLCYNIRNFLFYIYFLNYVLLSTVLFNFEFCSVLTVWEVVFGLFVETSFMLKFVVIK